MNSSLNLHSILEQSEQEAQEPLELPFWEQEAQEIFNKELSFWEQEAEKFR